MQRVSLLTASELAAALDDAGPPLILEATMGTSYGTAFVPGTVLFDLACIDTYLEDDEGMPLPKIGNYNLRPAAELRCALERHGVTCKRRCVVYTQCRRHTIAARGRKVRGHHHRTLQPAASREGVADPIVAARVVWCLAYAGVEDVALLDGGMTAWLSLGLATAPVPTPPCAAEDFFCGGEVRAFPLHPEFCAATEEIAAGGVVLGDVRSKQEYLGLGHDYAYTMPSGRIPGALHAPWGPSTFVGSELYRLPCGTLRTVAEVAGLWQRAGLLQQTVQGADASGETARLIFYCGCGWRSALAWLFARLMGHRNVGSFDGGVFEWGLDASRPFEAGEPFHARRIASRAVATGRGGEAQGWSFHAAADDDTYDGDGPAGRSLERQRRRQRALLESGAKARWRTQRKGEGIDDKQCQSLPWGAVPDA